MTTKTGASTFIGLDICSVWGTAKAAGATDKYLVDSLTFDENAQKLTINPIGSGLVMENDSARGATNPTVTAPSTAQYAGPGVRAIAALFGGCSVTQEASSYTHSILYNASRTKYCSLGWQYSGESAMELVTALPQSLRITAANPPNYVKQEISFIGSDIDTTPVNTTTLLGATTQESTKWVIVRPQDYFYIAGQTLVAALSATNKVNVTSCEVNITRPLEPVYEISGAASSQNALPRESGSPPFACTVTVTLRSAQDLEYFNSQQAGTEYRAELGVTGDLISGSNYYKMRYFFPRLKIVQWPSGPISSAGENPLTVVFEAQIASAIPAGMIDIMPHAVYTNASSTSLLTVA